MTITSTNERKWRRNWAATLNHTTAERLTATKYKIEAKLIEQRITDTSDKSLRSALGSCGMAEILIDGAQWMREHRWLTTAWCPERECVIVCLIDNVRDVDRAQQLSLIDQEATP